MNYEADFLGVSLYLKQKGQKVFDINMKTKESFDKAHLCIQSGRHHHQVFFIGDLSVAF